MEVDQLASLKKQIQNLISPIKPADGLSAANPNLLFIAKRTSAGASLPAYYLVYFLFVDLLNFENLGRFEKISWSIPIDYKGKVYLIEHRKMGLGIFVENPDLEEANVQEISVLINKAIKKAKPFFEHLVLESIKQSKINVINHSSTLFDRYQFLLNLCKEKQALLVTKQSSREISGKQFSEQYQLSKEVSWILLSAIEAFFSWTEHVFIHIAILNGNLQSADEIKELALDEWGEKFKKALTLQNPIDKSFYENLLTIRRELRNFIAHGSFGKNGESFYFHSGTGAVPVQLTQRDDKAKRKFTLGAGLRVSPNDVIETLERFTTHLWSGERAPAKMYIQATNLPSILTYAFDGSYQEAMNSEKDMRDFIQNLQDMFDRAANMDW